MIGKRLGCLLILLCGSRCIAQSIMLAGFGTIEEDQQLNRDPIGFYYALLGGDDTTLAFCDGVLKRFPDNRAASMLRTEALLNSGRIDECAGSLRELSRRDPDFQPLMRMEPLVALAAGNRQDAIAGFQRLIIKLQSKPVDEENWLHGQSPMEWEPYELKVLELEGRWDELERRLKSRLQADKTDSLAYQEFGKFCLSRGRYAEAITQFRQAFTLDKNRAGLEVLAMMYLVDLARAQWADRQDSAAFSTLLEASRRMMLPKKDVSATLAECLVMATVLSRTGFGTVEERATINERLRTAALRFSATRVYSLGNVARALAGESSMAESIARVKKVLRTAPHLDWALWAALYLGLADPASRDELFKLLPEGSVQRALSTRFSIPSPTP
jgi:tetratricopeptide (TPR) repeat protein